MKAVVLADVETIEVQDIAEPRHAPDEVLIRVGAGGICGSDMHAFHGRHPFRKPPVTMGHEAAGEVVAVGRDVTRVAVGDRVAIEPQIACMRCSLCLRGLSNLCQTVRRPGLGWEGTFAELMTAPERVVYRLARDTPFEVGALVEPAAVAMRAFRRGDVRMGDRVAVLGAGPIGGMIAHVAQRARAGALLVTDIKDFNLTFMHDLGIPDAVDPRQVDVFERCTEMTSGEGFDVVFVCPGKRDVVAEAARAVSAGGTLLLFTMAPPGEKWNADLFDLYFREVTVRPSYSCGPDDTSEALGRIARREVRVADLVSHRFPVGDSVEAFARARALEGSMKVAITF